MSIYHINSTSHQFKIRPEQIHIIRSHTGPHGTGHTGAHGIGHTGPCGPCGPRGVGHFGPKGKDGIGHTGPRGEDGLGHTGPKGENGPKGERGQRGESGLRGQNGPKGNDGIGHTGPRGDDGIGHTGPRGDDGIGHTGPRGDDGIGHTGPQGERGPVGSFSQSSSIESLSTVNLISTGISHFNALEVDGNTRVKTLISDNIVNREIYTDILHVKDQTQNFTGATSTSSGRVGLVPAPPAGYVNAFLKGDATWGFPDIPKPLPYKIEAMILGSVGNTPVSTGTFVNLSGEVAVGCGLSLTQLNGQSAIQITTPGIYSIQYSAKAIDIGGTDDYISLRFVATGGTLYNGNNNQSWCASSTSQSTQPVINSIFTLNNNSPTGFVQVQVGSETGSGQLQMGYASGYIISLQTFS